MIVFSRSFVRKRVISLATTVAVSATSFAFADDQPKMDHVRGAMPIQYAADRRDHPEEQAFPSKNRVAMNGMMADMAIKPSGDIDRDLVETMVPHHQGAVDMAKTEPEYGHNAQLRQRAQ